MNFVSCNSANGFVVRSMSNFAYCYAPNFLGQQRYCWVSSGILLSDYSKPSSASAESGREIFDRANFHPRVVSLSINVSSKVRRTAHGGGDGEGTEQCCLAKRSPRHYNLDFFTSNSSVYTDVFNLGILPLDKFSKKKE